MKSRTHRNFAIQNNSQPHHIITNDDLLTEILIRLPILCIHLFTTVSKQWLRILTSTQFTDRRKRIPNLDPPCGIFVNPLRSLYQSHFVSLDSRLGSKKATTMYQSFGYAEQVSFRILHSCNGLLLCCGSAYPVSYYVYNPTTSFFKRLSSSVLDLNEGEIFYRNAVFRLAFDPMISSHYRVLLVGGSRDDLWIEIYSSETGDWTLCKERYYSVDLKYFETATYWNDCVHLLEGMDRELKHCKLNIEDNERTILTRCQIRHGLHRGKKFLESFGGQINDPSLLFIKIPSMLQLAAKFFVSCGSLYLVCREDIGSSQFNIYEMMNGSTVWTVKYHVNIDHLMNPIPEEWSIRSCVWSVYIGKGEGDTFVVINLSGKVVKYHLATKTYIEIFHIQSYEIVSDDDDDDDDDALPEFIVPPYFDNPNISEFIPSLASV